MQPVRTSDKRKSRKIRSPPRLPKAGHPSGVQRAGKRRHVIKKLDPRASNKGLLRHGSRPLQSGRGSTSTPRSTIKHGNALEDKASRQSIQDKNNQIHNLQEENARLLSDTESPVSTTVWHTLHRVHCSMDNAVTTYADEPHVRFDKATDHCHWDSYRVIPDESRWEREEATALFVVYLEYKCFPSKGHVHNDRVSELDESRVCHEEITRYAGESVKILDYGIHEFIDKSLEGIIGSERYKREAVLNNQTLESPYQFFHHFRQRINDQCNSESEHDQTQIRILLTYLDESIRATSERMRGSLDVGKVDAALIELLFRPGELICVRENEELVVLRQESLMVKGKDGSSATAVYVCRTSEIVFDGKFHRANRPKDVVLEVPTCGDAYLSIDSLDVRPLANIAVWERQALLERGAVFYSCRKVRYVTCTERSEHSGHHAVCIRR